MNPISHAFYHTFNWSGHSDQKQFIVFTAFYFFLHVINSTVVGIVHAIMIATMVADYSNVTGTAVASHFGLAFLLHFLPTLICGLPWLALVARRLKDAGTTRLWMFVLITGIGTLVLMVVLALLPTKFRVGQFGSYASSPSTNEGDFY